MKTLNTPSALSHSKFVAEFKAKTPTKYHLPSRHPNETFLIESICQNSTPRLNSVNCEVQLQKWCIQWVCSVVLLKTKTFVIDIL